MRMSVAGAVAVAIAVALGATVVRAAPLPRDASGKLEPSPGAPGGTLEVRVVYNDLADPAVGLPVTLVGYDAGERVTVATQKTDREGRARFTGLDQGRATAYFAMALLPRGRDVDRLVSQAMVLESSPGGRVLLSGERRRSTAAALDDMPGHASMKAAAKGKVEVELLGAADAVSPVTLIDAATGKTVASATVTAPARRAVFEVAAKPGQVLYAESVAHGERLRSHPVLPIARGTAVGLFALPRALLRFAVRAEPAEPVLAVRGTFEVQNHSWIPYRAGEVPLPRGFKDAIFADADAGLADFTAAGFRLRDPVPPGGRALRIGFSLPSVKDQVKWELALPHGTFDSGMEIVREPGMTVEAPAGATDTSRAAAFVFDNIAVYPKQTMVMTIGMPKLPPAEKALARACSGMWPDRTSKLRGQRMPDFTAPGLDGKPLRLASLRGKLLIVHFTASYVAQSQIELPTFAKAAAAIPDLAIVLVSSNADPTQVADLIGASGAKSPFLPVLDPGVTADAIGPITKSWGVPLLPESFVIDRSGVVRLYLPNARDWSSAEAIACLKAVK